MKIRVADLHPGLLWKNFDALTRIPRPTRHEEQIRAHLLNIGDSLGLETLRDKAGNVIIPREAFATIGVPADLARAFQFSLEALGRAFRRELGETEPAICISAERMADVPDQWVDAGTQGRCPDERVHIPSVGRFWELLTGTLERI